MFGPAFFWYLTAYIDRLILQNFDNHCDCMDAQKDAMTGARE